MTQTATIAYGPTFTREVAEFVGENLSSRRVIDSRIYERPSFEAYEVSDGRVVKLTHHAAYDRITIYASFREYHTARHAGDRVAIDPETGRLGR